MKFTAPPLTPERFYILDKRWREWNERELRLAREMERAHLSNIRRVRFLKDKGYNLVDIARRLGMNERKVRQLLEENR